MLMPMLMPKRQLFNVLGHRTGLFAALALLVVVGIIAYSVRYLEWIEKEIDGGFTDVAVKDRFLAAQKFLGHYGVSVDQAQSVAMLDQPPSSEDLIIMTNTRRTLSRARVDSLLAWVAAGGRLILVAVEADSDDDSVAAPILDKLGVYMSYAYDEDEVETEEQAGGTGQEEWQREWEGLEGDAQASANQKPSDDWSGSDQDQSADQSATQSIEEAFEEALSVTPDSCLDLDGLARIRFDDDSPIGVEFWQGKYLRVNNDDAQIARSGDGVQLAIIPSGMGSIVALTSVELWESRHIHCHDNAHLLRVLSQDRGQVWWLFDTEMQPLQTIIWQRWPWFVAVAALWLLAWCWRAAVRTRAPTQQQYSERRNVLQHIDGIARFYYQQGRHDVLLSALRSRCSLNPDDERLGELAEQLDETPERIRWALTDEISSNPNDFSAAVQLLKRIEKSRKQNANEPME